MLESKWNFGMMSRQWNYQSSEEDEGQVGNCVNTSRMIEHEMKLRSDQKLKVVLEELKLGERQIEEERSNLNTKKAEFYASFVDLRL